MPYAVDANTELYLRPRWIIWLFWNLLLVASIASTALFSILIGCELALNDPQRTAQVEAEVTATGTNREVQYRFKVPGGDEWQMSSDWFGAETLWFKLSADAWNRVQQGNKTIAVVFVVGKPHLNRPVEEDKPMSTSNAVAAFFIPFALLLLWCRGLYHVVKGRRRCQQLIAEHQWDRDRFWRIKWRPRAGGIGDLGSSLPSP